MSARQPATPSEGPDAPPGNSPQRQDSEREGEEASPGEGEASDAANGNNGDNGIVVTPSRLRIDSRVLMAHTTSQWLTNAVFAMCILLKLDGIWGDASWWAIFAPTWLCHALHIPLQIAVLWFTDAMILRQIGPPPPATASAGLHMQYQLVLATRARSHVIDTTNTLIESVAMLVVKILFCWLLVTDQLGSISLRAIFSPFWVAWLVTTILNCMKDRAERVVGSSRDLLYVFLLFVAFQVDDQSGYSWRIVFIVPWIWFSALFLLAWVVLTLLLFARVWSRVLELLLPIGFFLLLASTAPQFVSYVNLVKALDKEADVSLNSILIPNAVSWFAMWLSSLLLGWGLRQKERVRDTLLASGAVWTMHEQVARRLRYQDQEIVRQKIDRMTEEEVAKLVEEMMAGKTKPLQLARVGNTLYKRITGDSMAPSDGKATESGAGGGGGMAGPESGRSSGGARVSPSSAAGTAPLRHSGPMEARLVLGPGEGDGAGTAGGLRPPGWVDEQQGSDGAAAGPSPRGANGTGGRAEGRTSLQAHAGADASGRAAAAGGVVGGGGVPGSRGAAPAPAESFSTGREQQQQLWLGAGIDGVNGVSVGPKSGTAAAAAGAGRSRPRSAAVGANGPPSPTDGPASSSLAHQTSIRAVRRVSSRLSDADRPGGLSMSAPQGPRTSVSGLLGMVNHVDAHFGIGREAPSARVIPEEEEASHAVAAPAATPIDVDAADDLCIICYDNEAKCVFLDCGHGGFCQKCAHLLFVRPPSECPTCRQPIEQVVELAELIPIGKVAAVK